MFDYGFTPKLLACRSPEEWQAVLAEDINKCCLNVATGRAILNALEIAFPGIEPDNDRALKRLRVYGLKATWQWSSEHAMALDLAELVEDLQALRLDGIGAENARYQYRYELMVLSMDKLDLDRGVAIKDALDGLDDKSRQELFGKLREGTKQGWDKGLDEARKGNKMFYVDPLGGAKCYANAELGRSRFVKSDTNFDRPTPS